MPKRTQILHGVVTEMIPSSEPENVHLLPTGFIKAHVIDIEQHRVGGDAYFPCLKKHFRGLKTNPRIKITIEFL